jgi:actin-related protein 2
VGSERFEAAECMFQPHLVDLESPGVAGTLLCLCSTFASVIEPVP